MGVMESASSVNPLTSSGGGVVGYNNQSASSDPTDQYYFDGGGVGLNVGVSLQSVWAYGSGTWTGAFKSVNVSASFFAGSIFWTPGPGGWVGMTFGLSVGFPGVSYEQTNYNYRHP
jgi:hypothetical protein